MTEYERLQLRLELAILRAAPPWEIEEIEQAKRQALTRCHCAQPLLYNPSFLFVAPKQQLSKEEIINKYRNSL